MIRMRSMARSKTVASGTLRRGQLKNCRTPNFIFDPFAFVACLVADATSMV
jgi:hypothetical protein